MFERWWWLSEWRHEFPSAASQLLDLIADDPAASFELAPAMFAARGLWSLDKERSRRSRAYRRASICLGLGAGPVTGEWNELTRRAFSRWQVFRGQEPSGELDYFDPESLADECAYDPDASRALVYRGCAIA